MPQNLLWGIGVEHEYRSVADDAKNFKPIAYRDRQMFILTDRNRLIDTRDLRWPPSISELQMRGRLRTGEKAIANVHEDGTVTPGYEIASDVRDGWEKTTVESQVKKLRKVEEFFLKKVRMPSGFKRKSNWPFGIHVSESGIAETGAVGSYHLTFTLPHEIGMSFTPEHRQWMKNFIRYVQWLEPLFISKLGGPHPASIGDGLPRISHSEGSIRNTLNEYANIGGNKVNDWPTDTPDNRHGGSTQRWRTMAKLSSLRNSNQGSDVRRRGNVGIEFRFMDSFDSQGLENLLKTMVYSASHAKQGNIEMPQDSTEWNEMTARILEEGWNTYLERRHIDKLRSALNLKVATNSNRAADVLSQIEKELWERNKRSETASLMIDNNGSQPKIHNFNRDAWDFLFRLKLRTDNQTKEKLAEIMKSLATVQYQSRNRAISTNDAGTKKGFRSLMEAVMGKKWAAEDARDIVDFLELNGLLDVKRNDDGSAKTIKPLYSASDIEMKLDKIINDPSFFAKDSGLKEYPFKRERTQQRMVNTLKNGQLNKTLKGVPNPPKLSVVFVHGTQNSTDRQFKILWTSSRPQPVGYRIFASSNNTDFFAFETTNLTTYQGREEGYYHVVAYNRHGTSDPSNVARIQYPVERVTTQQKDRKPPSPPRNLRISDTSDRTTMLIWDEPLEPRGTTTYKVFRDNEDGDDFTFIAITPIRLLFVGHRREPAIYTVVAFNRYGQSNHSNAVRIEGRPTTRQNATNIQPPPPPRNLRYRVYPNENRFRLIWDDVPNIQRFTVWFTNDPNGGSAVPIERTRRLEFMGSEEGYYSVVAEGTHGNSQPSEWRHVYFSRPTPSLQNQATQRQREYQSRIITQNLGLASANPQRFIYKPIYVRKHHRQLSRTRTTNVRQHRRRRPRRT